MPSVWLGNPGAIERVMCRHPDGTPVLTAGRETYQRVPLDGARWVWAGPDDRLPVATFLIEIDALWPSHSDGPGPSWVASDDPAWAQAIATKYRVPIVVAPEVHAH